MSNIGGPDEATTGPILVQGLLQYLCQGIIISQGVKFWTRRTEGTTRSKVYVTTLVFLSILQTALETYKTWLELIVRRHWWTSPLHWAEFLLNGIICTLCEVFLIRRCWKVTERNNWVLFSLASLSAAIISANIYLAVKIGEDIGAETGYADPLKAGSWAFPLWIYGSLVLALSLTCILSYFLRKSKTGLSYLDRTVNSIIEITWETAALPSVSAILAATFYSSKPVTHARHLDLFFSLLIAKLYTLGILRTINLRVVFRQRLTSTDLGRTSLNDFRWDQAASSGTTSSQKVRRRQHETFFTA
ncbi:hypothetical protein WOLCODRAFT_16742 [Wolfiporia cocos MD-104 SS10]|uniref:DUF6534 domain-containing protein n=1 Tax=Wolfiporia cocos (strain MD-104) TaxID=742152 RepID=A0A2H3JLZ4_WOLCO|nr:hypothetical protein WOLCODRAFT_16742 [Wolfiporia cocos MD-104 SS10]